MDIMALERDGLLRAADLAHLFSSSQLRRAVATGDLLRLRRGSYVRQATWAALRPEARHVVRMRAVEADVRGRVVFAGDSAGVLWGLLDGSDPPAVSVLGSERNRGGPRHGVRRIRRGGESPDVVERLGFTTTGLAKTALDMAARRSFPAAVAVLDSALSRRRPDAVDKRELRAAVIGEAWPFVVPRAAAFATHLSDSPGESEARAIIHLLGFPPPQLQHEFADEEGQMRVDFYWPDQGVVAEFDGIVKYTREAFTQGDPSALVWREKRREDRLRRQVRTVVRFTTEDVRSPVRLRELLSRAGLPRERAPTVASAWAAACAPTAASARAAARAPVSSQSGR
jgi:hypothetical protein